MTTKKIISDIRYSNGEHYQIYFDFDRQMYDFTPIKGEDDMGMAMLARIVSKINNKFKQNNYSPDDLHITFWEDSDYVRIKHEFKEPEIKATLMTRFLVSYDGSLVYTKHGYGTLINQTPEIEKLIEQLTMEIEKQT